MNEKEKRKAFHALLYPTLFIFFLWLIKSIEVLNDWSLHDWGVFPRLISNLAYGPVFMPLLHSDWQHLFSNSVALFVLGFLLIFFYRPLHFKIFWVIYFGSGLITWAIGRPSYHIGASGIIYGLMSFLLLSGILRKHAGLMAVSAVTVLSYGSIVWGIFPFAFQFSWEGHLGGFVTGILLAIVYRNQGPQRKVFVWKEDPEKEHDEWMINQESFPEDSSEVTDLATDNKPTEKSNYISIVYTYKISEKNKL